MAAVASCRITEPETTGVSGRKSLFERRFCRRACVWRTENDRLRVRAPMADGGLRVGIVFQTRGRRVTGPTWRDRDTTRGLDRLR